MTTTPPKSFRFDDEDWERAKARAQLEHRTLSDVIRIALRAYADGRYHAIEPKRSKR